MSDLRKSPLRILIEEGMLVISIGVDTLVFACEQGEALRDEWGNARGVVVDHMEFAQVVADALQIESCSGQTDLQVVIDKAMELAIESGTESVQLRDDTDQMRVYE